MTPRALWFLGRDMPLTCAAGHVIPQITQLIEDGFLRCTHRAPGGGTCNLRTYVLQLPRRAGGRPLTLVADVTGQEIREILASAHDVDAILDTLGLVWSHYHARRGIPPPALAPPDRAS